MANFPAYLRTLNPPTSLLGLREKPAEKHNLVFNHESMQSAITPRQRQVLHCLIEGKPTKKICTELGMSEGTAKVHIAAIFRALRVRNRTQATLAAIEQGWIYPEAWSRA